MQLNDTKLKLCIKGCRGSNQEISHVLDGDNCSNFTLIQRTCMLDIYDIQVSQKSNFRISLNI